MRKRILGLDVGDVRIGVAVSDALGITAQAVTTIQRKGQPEDVRRIQELLAEYEAAALVVGLPLNMDGNDGPQAQKVRAFADALKSSLDAEIVFWDERLTTAEARRVLIEGGMRRKKRKSVIDQLAAVLILQSYLDARPGESSAHEVSE